MSFILERIRGRRAEVPTIEVVLSPGEQLLLQVVSDCSIVRADFAAYSYMKGLASKDDLPTRDISDQTFFGLIDRSNRNGLIDMDVEWEEKLPELAPFWRLTQAGKSAIRQIRKSNLRFRDQVIVRVPIGSLAS